jgi:hypothetical protein
MTRKYKYRNLPCTVGRWFVSGIDRATNGGGVLEWCESEEDAYQVMAAMHQDPRFADLSVGQREEGASACAEEEA